MLRPPVAAKVVSAQPSLNERASAAARILTLRGLLMRMGSAGSGLALLTFLSPADYGLLAVVRAFTTALEQGTELGLSWPLLRQAKDPSREEYASLAGAQFAIVALVLGICALWNGASTIFGALDAAWRPWLLGVLAAMLVVPFGTGARIRLERDLRYGRIAFVEVSTLVIHAVVLLAFLFARHFAIGIFVAQMVSTLYQNGALYASSRGPLPSWNLKVIFAQFKNSAGWIAAYMAYVGRDQVPVLLLGTIFDLRIAGIWAFAVRLSKLLQFTYEGFARVAVPTAARLADDGAAQRRLVRDSLKGASLLGPPAAAMVVFALPVLPFFWPQWGAAVPLSQAYVPCDVLTGVIAAGLAPVAMARRGWRAVLVEHLLPLCVACGGIGVVSFWSRANLTEVTLVYYASVLIALFLITDAEILPGWQPEYTSVILALGVSFTVFFVAQRMGLQPMVTAAIAGGVLAAWVWRQWIRYFGGKRPQTSLNAARGA